MNPSESTALLRKFTVFIIFLLILKALQSGDPKPPNANQIEKLHSNSVGKWLVEEAGIDQTVLVTLQSYRICLIEDNIPQCIKELLDNLKSSSGVNPRLLQFLHSKSSHETSLAKHLWEAARDKKRKLVLAEWLRQNKLMNSNLQGQLEELKIYSMLDLSGLYQGAKQQISDGHYSSFKVCKI